MNTAFASVNNSGTDHVAGRSRGFAAFFLFAVVLAEPFASSGAELKQETLKSWNAYVNSRLNSDQSPLFPVTEGPDYSQRLQQGEILVSSGSRQNPKRVPSGLIHDWIGTSFIPNTTIDSVLSVLRDYGDYKDFYKPTVVDSKVLATAPGCDTYSLRVVNKEKVAQTALDLENQTCYTRVDERRWYSVTQSTRVQEVRHFATPEEEELPPDQGSGYVWRLYSTARFEQKDGGVYIEVEAIALSRDIPAAVRWLVDPIVRRVSRNSIFLSLQETGQAVRLTMTPNSPAEPLPVHQSAEAAPGARTPAGP